LTTLTTTLPTTDNQATEDSLPELAEQYEIVLTVDAEGASVATDGGASAIIIIAPSDDANGIFGVDAAQSSAVVLEDPQGSSMASIVVTRRGGDQGIVTLDWAVTGLCVMDTPGDTCGRTRTQAEDFAATQPLAGQITFAEGQRSATITLEVVNDVVAEGDELTTVRLALQPGAGITGGLDTDAATFTFAVAANDDGNGIFTFASDSRAADVAEGDDVTLTIVRTLAAFGEVAVAYEVRSATSDPASDDITGVGGGSGSGTVTFADGEVSRTITFSAVTDSLPEEAEHFSVVLTGKTALSLLRTSF